MKKLSSIELELWFTNKDKYLTAAMCNASYFYEVVTETEKAVQIKIESSSWNDYQKATKNWTKWIPKSAIIKM